MARGSNRLLPRIASQLAILVLGLPNVHRLELGIALIGVADPFDPGQHVVVPEHFELGYTGMKSHLISTIGREDSHCDTQ